MIDDVTYDDQGHKHFEWCEEEAYYDLLIKHAQYLKKIKIGGGEPFLVARHFEFINKLIELDVAKDIEIEYSINVTVLPQEILELIHAFKSVKLCCSVDGYGVVNDAIRHPSKWHIIERNLNFIDANAPSHAQVFTSTTVSILNIEHFVTWMQWLEDMDFIKINKDTYAGVVSHPVMNPKYLNLRLMTDEQHTRMFVHLKQQTSNPDMIKKLTQWEMYSKKLPMTEQEIIQGRKDLKEFFIKMSKIQQRDWAEVFPMCYTMITEWNE
jgi:sulfatase maturation enzyme AslB (radical SAM superfamily)